MNTTLKSVVRVAASAMCALALMASFTVAEAKIRSPFVPGQVIVRINPLSGATIEQINSTYGTTIIEALPPAGGSFLLRAAAGVNAVTLVEQMDLDPRLAFAELNGVQEAPEANPRLIGAWAGTDPAPYFGQRAVPALGIVEARAIAQGANVVVAVIDTGIAQTHPELAASLVPGFDFVDGDAVPDDTPDGVDNDGDGLIDEAAGHGTHVAGIVHLVAPLAKLMPLRVLDSDGRGDAADVAKAIAFAIEHGATVINLSLGSQDKSELMELAVQSATRAGAVVVAAAGNLGGDRPQSPAGAGCAIAVASVGASYTKSDFSNYGSWVDLAAPGEDIVSAYLNQGYAIWRGTSMATPFVAGQAALIQSVRPGANARDALGIIGATARNLDKIDPKFGTRLGMGAIDILASTQFAASASLAPESGLAGSCVQP